MIRSRKKQSIFIFLLAFVAFGASLYPTLHCVDSLQKELMNVNTNDIEVQALQKRVVSQPSLGNDRMKLVLPICRQRKPIGDVAPWLAIAGILAITGFLPLLGKDPEEKEDEYIPPAPMRLEPAIDVRPESKRAPIEVAFEITPEEESEAEQDSDSKTLMAYVQKVERPRQRQATSSLTRVRHDSTVGSDPHKDRMIFFVDPENPQETATRFVSIDAAIRAAQRKVLEDAQSETGLNLGVQIRVFPGIYQLSLEIPPNIVLVNHKMPNFKELRKGLLWVSEQELDDLNRVTILADPQKKHGVKFVRGTRQGIFGCHIVGRGDSQTGILIDNAEGVEIVNCVIEQFGRCGIAMKNSGSELPDVNVSIRASMIRFNAGEKGGGIRAMASSFTLESSIIRENVAWQGGGIFVEDAKAMIEIREVRLEKNVAKSELEKKVNPNGPLDVWQTTKGLGGGIYAIGSRIKLVDLECVENTAFVAGGGIASLESKLVIQNNNFTSRVERNRSQIGGGLFVVGRKGKSAVFKIQESNIRKNMSKSFGGGFAVIGESIVQCNGASIRANKARISGGGCACFLGGSADFVGGELMKNSAEKNGGGILASNGRVRLRGQAEVVYNSAKESGGGIFAITESAPYAVNLAKRKHLKLPLRILLEDTAIRYNTCGKLGPALRLGNLKPDASLPMQIEIGGKCSIRSNESATSDEDIFVTWAGERLSTDIAEYEEVLLR